jgi:plastocyanin
VATYIAAAFLGYSFPATAAMTNVTVFSNGFNPTAVTINVNDSVKWTWTGNSHSTTSTGGLWDSGVHNSGFTFTNKFTSSGNFPYICTVHTFMTGSVTVQAGLMCPLW